MWKRDELKFGGQFWQAWMAEALYDESRDSPGPVHTVRASTFNSILVPCCEFC